MPSSSSSSSVMKILKLIVIILQALTLMITAQNPQPISHFTIQGSVFCDVCSIGAFSRHSYFLPGVDVHIECKMKANSGGNSEQIAFSVNRTTNKHGVYRVDIKTALEGIESPSESIQSFCKASLTNSSSSSSKCSVPGLKTSTTTQLTLKSKQNNLCIYSLSPLSYTPLKKNVSLCSSNNNNDNNNKPNPFNSSKFFLPNFPPFGFVFTWPPLPSLPPLPQLPPLPSLPPWPPFLPFPFYFPPSLPPFPPSSPPYTFPTPPFRPMPFFQFPPPNPPPPGAPYNPRDPSTWIPNYPAPQQPGYNFGNDPRTWIPYYYPPSPPQNP